MNKFQKDENDNWYTDNEDKNDIFNADYCYECSGYGDDYFINENGELECYCPQCPFHNPDV
jgi:hypothetical protein